MLLHVLRRLQQDFQTHGPVLLRSTRRTVTRGQQQDWSERASGAGAGAPCGGHARLLANKRKTSVATLPLSTGPRNPRLRRYHRREKRTTRRKPVGSEEDGKCRPLALVFGCRPTDRVPAKRQTTGETDSRPTHSPVEASEFLIVIVTRDRNADRQDLFPNRTGQWSYMGCIIGLTLNFERTSLAHFHHSKIEYTLAFRMTHPRRIMTNQISKSIRLQCDEENHLSRRNINVYIYSYYFDSCCSSFFNNRIYYLFLPNSTRYGVAAMF